ncbi:glycosyltransferase involved in cell wall biosynthesis [Arthrobacter pigmenti]|uniref:4,4'-diaponeurosporenoate glycosyltransferase n=1 Tax=Arthrobacter pigmenti TaxID=271432 RepID=A0A846RVI8_9MICC|nr:glycosyltransferase family 2 protein [Arthrobacter pigmenti]NJC24492.1 glycosyltransferase involved in cell wall biosynthesis [Arthrobacter pigmenti]
MPSLSVVIPCKDDAGPLARCLEALSTQRELPLEILVVDNGSIDDSADIAKRFGAVVLSEPAPGIAAAASTGYDSARGDIIIRCDADTLPPTDWLERIAHRFANEPDLGVLTGPGIFYDTSPVRARLAGVGYMNAYFILMGAAMAHWPPFGSNLAFRRAVWHQSRSRVNRHDPDVHDDVDLGFALDPSARTAFDGRLRVGISARSLAGGHEARVRIRRAFHTIGLHWRVAPPWERWRLTLTKRK